MRWVAAAILLLGCGAAPAPAPTAPSPLTEKRADETDAYAEVSRFFDRKRPQVSQCYADALAANAVDPRGRGYVTVALTVPPSGRPEKVRIADATLKSPFMEECIVKLVSRWVLPKPGEPLEFSFSYNFLPE